jgi:hypothetical protein
MRIRTITRSAAVVLASLGLVVGGASAAAAKDDTPGHSKNGKFVTGCSAAELTTETGGSDIIGGTGVAYHHDAVNGGGTFDFTFQLASASCLELTYRVDVYDYNNGTWVDGASPIASSTRSGDFVNSAISAPTVTLPASYSDSCVLVVVSSLNGATTLDRAPDFFGNEVCDGQGGSQLWH